MISPPSCSLPYCICRYSICFYKYISIDTYVCICTIYLQPVPSTAACASKSPESLASWAEFYQNYPIRCKAPSPFFPFNHQFCDFAYNQSSILRNCPVRAEQLSLAASPLFIHESNYRYLATVCLSIPSCCSSRCCFFSKFFL